MRATARIARIAAAALALSSCATLREAPPPVADPPDAASSATWAAPDASSAPGTSTAAAPSGRTLYPAEIREYQGETLGSVSDFPDNSILGPQAVDIGSYRLVVDGLVERPLSLSYAEALGFPIAEKAITLHCVEGWSVRALWEGPLLSDIVEAAIPDPDANTIILEAADGYSTTMSLEHAREREIILASRINGIVLPPERGFPFQLAAEDKWGYKWIKWVTRITLSIEDDYRGTYERQGYSVDGSLKAPRKDYGPPPEGQERQ